MIDEIFWPFSIKAAAERLNSMKIDLKVRTPESILQGVEVENIPVKYYYILFFPIYALDVCLHSAEGVGPPKWGQLSRIGVYVQVKKLVAPTHDLGSG